MPNLKEIFSSVLKLLAISPRSPLTIACSGGADSMALALLAQDWAKTPITALTVDHGLRSESAKEARQVGIWLKKQGIGHVTLTWKGKKPTANIQEAARKARYRLTADYCAAHGIKHLLVAHTLEDQAETFLLRLARGSGVDGLSAMAPTVTLYGVNVVRPLLGVPKSKLLAYLKTRKQPHLNDPSNENPAFDRVRVRQMMPELLKLGLSAERLAATAANMARARTHLEEETGRYLASACTVYPEGYAVLRYVRASEEIALRALSNLIMMIGGLEVRTRLSDLERLYAALNRSGFKGATLGGCVLKSLGAGPKPQDRKILVFREMKAVEAPTLLKSGEEVMWDNRFEVALSASDIRGLRVGALTQEGWLFCANRHKVESTLPDKRILYSLPALRDRDGWLYAVPHLGLTVEGVDCRATFRMLGLRA